MYASCQKFVNSLPALHRQLQCHSRCHFLLGEVVISNFNFAMWSTPCARIRACVCMCKSARLHAGPHVQRFICVGLSVCVCVSKLEAAGLCVTAKTFDV